MKSRVWIFWWSIVSDKIFETRSPLPSYEMLIASLLPHSWSALLNIASHNIEPNWEDYGHIQASKNFSWCFFLGSQRLKLSPASGKDFSQIGGGGGGGIFHIFGEVGKRKSLLKFVYWFQVKFNISIDFKNIWTYSQIIIRQTLLGTHKCCLGQNSALVTLDKWSFYRGGRLSRFNYILSTVI